MASLPSSEIVSASCFRGRDKLTAHSELGREAGIGFYIMKLIIARSTEVGSRTLVHAATAGGETHGQYLSDCSITLPSPLVLSAEGHVLQKRVWDELSKKLEAIKPGVMKNL
jgi:hypothetical protein